MGLTADFLSAFNKIAFNHHTLDQTMDIRGERAAVEHFFNDADLFFELLVRVGMVGIHDGCRVLQIPLTVHFEELHNIFVVVAVSYTHLIIVDKEECDMDADDLMMIALDAGAEDFADEEDSFEITTAPEDFSAVRENLENEGIPMASAEVTMIPQTWGTLSSEEDIKKMNRILDLLDDDDDVQNVYHNWDE